MSGRHDVGGEIAGGLEQILELDRLVAGDARHRRLPGHIALGEGLHHLAAEALLIVRARNAECRCAAATRRRVVNVLAGAAGALPAGRRAMIVKLQRDADDVVALALQQRGHHRGIHAAGHGDDDARILRRAGQHQAVQLMAAAAAGRETARSPCRVASGSSFSIVTVAVCGAKPLLAHTIATVRGRQARAA